MYLLRKIVVKLKHALRHEEKRKQMRNWRARISDVKGNAEKKRREGKQGRTHNHRGEFFLTLFGRFCLPGSVFHIAWIYKNSCSSDGPSIHCNLFFPRWWFSICGPNQNLRAVPHHCSYSPTRKWGGPSSGFFTVVCQRIHNIVRWSVSPFLERALSKIPSWP